jgi:putative oxidoreductase
MKALKLYQTGVEKLQAVKDLPPLIIRLILAYGFYGPAMMKLGNIDSIAGWFGQMGLPFPTLNAYLATGTEVLAFILLPLGLATRFISIPLMFTMLVAIFTVHIGNGFDAGNNGFEIPLYYLIMLLYLFINGAGKISIDNLVSKRVNK